MTFICLGPCCIPLSAFLPFLLFMVSPILKILRKTPLAKYLPGPNVPKTKTNGTSIKECCAEDRCNNGGTAASAGNVTVVNSLEHWEELKTTEPLLVVDFTAGWCMPCKKMAPVFEELARKYEGAACFVKVDIDDVPDAFDGTAVPSFHVLKGGAKVDNVNGAAKDRLKNMVDRHCKKSN